MKLFVIAGLAMALASTSAYADGGKIWTGSDSGAYHSTFCPPLPEALANKDFPNYKCATSGGTMENIQKVLATPTDIGFVQLDVYAREQVAHPDYKDKLTVIRSDIACEGLWMVTKNTTISNFGDILGSRRTPFVLPAAASGSAASFQFVQSLDPDGLGRAKNIRNVADAKAVIETVAAGNDRAVGFFVQFADPRNANIKLMQDRSLIIVPVVSREIANAKIDGQDLYSIQSYTLTDGGWIASAKTATTACTPVAIITGNPAGMKKDQQDDQKDMVKAIRDVKQSALLPKDDRLASLMKSVRSMSASGLNDILAGVDKAKQAALKAAGND
jgi:hypothetical protein